MKETYTIPEWKRSDIEKKIERYLKKATKYGSPLAFSLGKPYAKSVKTNTGNNVTIEVFDLTINSEEIKKNGYTLVGMIEHLTGGNIVTPFNTALNSDWSHAKPYCEHCGVKRFRRYTFIVRDDKTGEEHQIGSDCLKDYSGIDPQELGYRNEFIQFVEDEDTDHYDFDDVSSYPKAYDPIKVLAVAIRVLKKQGYVKSGNPNSNKERIFFEIDNYPTADEMKEAQKMATDIQNMNEKDAKFFLLDDTKVLLDSEYCKSSHFGYLAYAPVAYEKYKKELEKRAKKEAELDFQRTSSEYVGTVGERIVIDIAELNLVTSWETEYGYTYLYKFIDTNGNVYIWFASRTISEKTSKIKATVKDHTERDGVKQTVVTRCSPIQ